MIRSKMNGTAQGSDIDRRDSLVYVIPLSGDQFDDISPSDTSSRIDEDSEVENNSETSFNRSADAYLDNVLCYFDHITNTRTDQPEVSYDVSDNLNDSESDSGKSSQSADDSVQPMAKLTTNSNIALNMNSLDEKCDTSMSTSSESGQSQANDSNSTKPTKQRKVSVVRFDSSIETINVHSSVKVSDCVTDALSNDKCNDELILSPKELITKCKSINSSSWKEEQEAESKDMLDHSDSGADETKNGSVLNHAVCRDNCDIKTEANDNTIITEDKDAVSQPTGIMIHNGSRRHNDQRASVDFSLGSSRDSIDRIRFSLVNSRLNFARWSSLTDLFGDDWKKDYIPLWKRYQLHIFVGSLFVLILTFVSLSLYYHKEQTMLRQLGKKIIFQTEERTLRFTGELNDEDFVEHLGKGIPSWRLPLECTEDSQENLCLRWKGTAELNITHFAGDNVQCYNVSWESLSYSHSPIDCFRIGTAKWYGATRAIDSTWPIHAVNYSFSPVISSEDNGVFGSVVERYWLSSAGIALLVDYDVPLHLSWNHDNSDEFCFLSQFSDPYYVHNSNRLPHLKYILCKGSNIVQTHKYVRNLLPSNGPQTFPSDDMFLYPHWTTVNIRNSATDQSDVTNLAKAIKFHDLKCCSLNLNMHWEKKHGDLEFDVAKFPNVYEMIQIISNVGCGLSLTLTPYCHYSSKCFAVGMEKDYFVKDSGGTSPGLIKWKNGISAVLDILNHNVASWYKSRVDVLTSRYNISSYQFSHGQTSLLPSQAHFIDSEISPNLFTRQYANLASIISPKATLQSASQSQDVSAFVVLQTSIETDGLHACMRSVIPSLLRLGIMGYPFIMADGFSRNLESVSLHDGLVSRELFIRWIQLATFFPAIRYNIKPWNFDSSVVQMARNASLLHESLIIPAIEAIKEEVKDGYPIIRPMWWIDPLSESALVSDSQFIVGDGLVVAPVLCEGQKSVDIYLPAGIWSDQLRSTLVVGKTWLRNYAVGLYEIPHFIKMTVHTN